MAGKRVLSKRSKSCRRSAAGCWSRVVTLALLAAALMLAPRLAQARKWSYLTPAGQWAVIDDAVPRTKPAFSPTTSTLTTGGITWNVTFLDPDGVGFNDPDYGGARRGCATRALNAIGAALGNSQQGTLNVVFTESFLDGSSYLAVGGTYFPDPSSEPCFYSGFAYEHLKSGIDPSPDLEDIYCTVDFGYNWYTGSGTPPADAYDLTSVLLHELTHGMGFMSLLASDGTSVITHTNPGIYSGFDSKLVNGSLTLQFDYKARFTGIVADLIGNAPGIFFGGYNAFKANKTWPRIYTPARFEDYSSLSHWDASLTGSVMVPQMMPGTVRRTYSTVDRAALADTGWVVKGIQATAVKHDWTLYQ